jgi:RNA polymerase sigma-70 factor (ECF subfamily)
MSDLGLTLNRDVPCEAAAPPDEPERCARALVSEHFDFIWRVMRRLGVPESEAEDAAQQVFIVATARLSEIRPGAERSFLYGTALRVAGTIRRGLQRRRRWFTSEPADCVSPERAPDEQVERQRQLALLDEVLSELAPELREVFVLCEIEELSASEVAGIARIPVGTVASRLRRARRSFHDKIQQLTARRRRAP